MSLADRNILANQAYNAFSAFPEDALVRIEPSEISKKGRVPKNGSLFFTIFQTFMSGPGGAPHFGEYPADFFDFFVIDECHRGGANNEGNWRGILDYFAPAVQLDLTATPKRKDNVDTYAYFGEPVFTYSLKDGINDGFLTPFRVKQIQTTMDYYTFISDDTVVEGEIEVGKVYFTIYDFVMAHKHFADPEWDGEPADPETCPKCGVYPCVCETPPPQPCPVCGKSPCDCPKEKCPICDKQPCVCRKKNKVKVKLADGKDRTIQHMSVTSFWHPDGTPMSAQQFMESLFGKLPEFFKNEDELRTIWSQPETRRHLLEQLAEQGFGGEQLAEMQKIIDAEKSDIFDVLSYVAYASPPITREERAGHAKESIHGLFNPKQQAFLDFVLSHYISVGVEELDMAKLAPLLRLKYHDSIPDAVADLGEPETISETFSGFQKFLYEPAA